MVAKALYYPVVSDRRLTAMGQDCHLLAVLGVAPHWGVYGAAAGHRANAHRAVLALDAALLQLAHQIMMGRQIAERCFWKIFLSRLPSQ